MNIELKQLSQPVQATQAAAADEPDLTSTIVNDACWKFIEAMPHQLPGPIWNDLKPALYATLIHYHRAILTLRPERVPMTDEQPDPYSPDPKRRMLPGRYIIRINDDGEFGQATGWLYRVEGPDCLVSGAPVYVWRPLSDLIGPKTATAPSVPDAIAPPVEDGTEYDYCSGRAAGYAEGWDTCRAAMLATKEG